MPKRDPADLNRDGQLPPHPSEVPSEPMQDPKATEEERTARAGRAANLKKLAPALGDILDEAFDRMLARAEGRERPVPLPDGLDGVGAELGGGLWPGLYVLVGAPKSGKSQLALQVAANAAAAGTPVLYVALELGKVDLVARLAGLRARRNWSRLYYGSDAEEIRLVRDTCAAELRRLPFHVEVAPPYGWGYAELEPRARALHEHYEDRLSAQPCRSILVVLDFLQIVNGDERDLRERIQKAVYAGRAIARELDAVVLLVSSAARDHYPALNNDPPRDKEGRPPKGWQPLGQGDPGRFMGIGKESGEIEFSADGVLVLGRERGADLIRDPETNALMWSTSWLAVAALRARPAAANNGWIRLWFNGGRFRQPPPGWLPPAPAVQMPLQGAGAKASGHKGKKAASGEDDGRDLP